MMGSILELFLPLCGRNLLGRRLLFHTDRTRLQKALDWADCRYQSLTGLVEVSVRRKEGGRLEVSCRIPANTVGTLEVNGKAVVLTGGITTGFPEKRKEAQGADIA